jgi:hypothetical protein
VDPAVVKLVTVRRTQFLAQSGREIVCDDPAIQHAARHRIPSPWAPGTESRPEILLGHYAAQDTVHAVSIDLSEASRQTAARPA